MQDCVLICFFFCSQSQSNGKPAAGNEHLAAIAEALTKEGTPTEYAFTDRDAILYNLGVGAKRKELKYVL
jgi:multifunctional beta-oxidation protein